MKNIFREDGIEIYREKKEKKFEITQNKVPHVPHRYKAALLLDKIWGRLRAEVPYKSAPNLKEVDTHGTEIPVSFCRAVLI